jgi:hypothetical protein
MSQSIIRLHARYRRTLTAIARLFSIGFLDYACWLGSQQIHHGPCLDHWAANTGQQFLTTTVFAATTGLVTTLRPGMTVVCTPVSVPSAMTQPRRSSPVSTSVPA